MWTVREPWQAIGGDRRRDSASEVVQGIAHRAERRLVVLVVNSDSAGRVLDSGSVRSERNDRAAPQQPEKPGFVITGKSPISWGWFIGDRVQAEQVSRRPAEQRSLFTPCSEKATPILDGLQPIVRLDVVGAAALKYDHARFVRRRATT